jgi:hypothetical protein
VTRGHVTVPPRPRGDSAAASPPNPLKAPHFPNPCLSDGPQRAIHHPNGISRWQCTHRGHNIRAQSVAPRGTALGARGSAPTWISQSVDQWWKAHPRSTEEPRPGASNARSQRPATRAIGVSRALACALNTRGCPHVLYTAPVIRSSESSILCGCINVPGRQVNAVWGRCPTACTMCVKKNLECKVCWGLVDKISPTFELRNSVV